MSIKDKSLLNQFDEAYRKQDAEQPCLLIRYELHYYDKSRARRWETEAWIEALCFKIIKHTNKGYWIEFGESKKWVSKTGKRRYAYPNSDEAHQDFVMRLEKRIEILKHKLEFCNNGIKILQYNNAYPQTPAHP